MTIWSILAAPLIMSVDLDRIRPEFKDILLNKHAIGINQDTLGIQGKLVSNTNSIQVWKKTLQSTRESQQRIALGIVSCRSDGYYYPYDILLSEFFNDDCDKFSIIDAFGDNNLAIERLYLKSENVTVRVPPTGAVLLLITAV